MPCGGERPTAGESYKVKSSGAGCRRQALPLPHRHLQQQGTAGEASHKEQQR